MPQIRNATYQNFLNHRRILSDTLFLHLHARAIERSQSDQISNVFVCLPCFALHRMYTGTPRHAIERSFGFNRSTDGPIGIPASYFVSNSRIRTIMQCSEAVNEIQHNRGEVQQITHKGSIQLTILRL